MEKSKQVGIIHFEEETLKNMFIILFAVLIISFTAIPCNTNASITTRNPAADGHYHYYYSSCALCLPENCEGSDCEVLKIEIENKIKVEGTYWKAPGHGARIRTGLVEFDISGLDCLYARGEMQATIVFKIKDGNCWLDLYSMQDANENGTIDLNDIETGEYIGQVFTQEVPSNVISFDVTSALEHDLFNPDQTNYSGFVLKGCEYEYIEIYDHTDSVNAPRLNISDGDDIPDGEDNCPYHYNPSQEDTYPPEGNGVGDACDCEGDFDCDGDCDGTDAATFKLYFGRSPFNYPCNTLNPCNGDFDCDNDCDGTDASLFKQDFGRSGFNNPCPACVMDEWCVYE